MNSTNTIDKRRSTFITDTQVLNGLKNEHSKEYIKFQKKETIPSKEEIQEISQSILENKLQLNEKKKKKNNIYEKILLKPPSKDFYSNYEITPGINFIKKLFSHEKADKYIPNLKINIPETFWNDTENFYIFNDPQNYNKLTMIKNQRDPELFKAFKSIEISQYKREFDELTKVDPLFVVRTQDSFYENSVKVERYETAEENLTKDLGDVLIQRFIRSKGRNRELNENKANSENYINYLQDNKLNAKQVIDSHSDQNLNKYDNDSEKSEINLEDMQTHTFVSHLKINQNIPINANALSNKLKSIDDGKKKSYTRPNIIRLEYKTRYNSSKKHNVGYVLLNKNNMEPIIRQKKKESLDKYSQICTVNTSNPESFDIYIMAGDALKPYEFYANEIVTIIQNMFKLLLKTIVIDFIKDERGKILFLGVKAFVPYKSRDEIKRDLNVDNQLKDEKNLKKFYKTLTCKLCLLSYPKAEITKLVTYKLLIQLKNNLSKRGKRTFSHITNHNVNRDYSTMCNVCDLCYTLLITEQELMEIQKSIALCNNIQIPPEEEIERKNYSPKNMNKILNKVKFVNQWRILFYFIIDLKSIELSEETNYKLYIKIFDQKFGIPILNDVEKFKSNDEVEINNSKIFYFFTNDNSNLKNILKKEEVDFRLVLNENWENPIAQCQTCCLSFFDNESMVKNTVTVKKTLNLFLTDANFFKCQVYIGLNNDMEIPAENLPLYNYKMTGSLFLTYLDYFSYHPLPDDWIELFLPESAGIGEYHDYKNEWMDKIVYGKRYNKNIKTTSKENVIKEDTVYDPYETLVQIQDKKNLISKIKSIPVIYDKNYDDKKRNTRSRPNTSIILSKFGRNSQMNTESNGKYLYPKTDNRHLLIQQSNLPSIASFKTSSNKDNTNSESKYKKKTDLLDIHGKMTDEMLDQILGNLDSKKKKISNESSDSV